MLLHTLLVVFTSVLGTITPHGCSLNKLGLWRHVPSSLGELHMQSQTLTSGSLWCLIHVFTKHRLRGGGVVEGAETHHP